LVFFDEVYESGPLDFDWLALTVEKRQNEVKEIALAKVTRRLLLKVRPTQAHATHLHAAKNLYEYELHNLQVANRVSWYK